LSSSGKNWREQNDGGNFGKSGLIDRGVTRFRPDNAPFVLAIRET